MVLLLMFAKVIGINPGMQLKKLLDRASLMHTASVPQEDKPSFKVLEQVSQERQHLGMTNVLQRMKADIQSDSPFARRDANGGNGRDFCPSAGDFKNWGLPYGRPCLSDGRDKTKPALVKKDEGQVKPFGLFLYAVIDSASSALFPFHPVRAPWSQAFGSSIQDLAKPSRHERDDTKPRSVFQSLQRFSLRSKDPWSSLELSAHPQEPSLTTVSDARLACTAGRARALASRHHPPVFCKDQSNSRPSLTNNQVSRLFAAASFLHPRARGPAACTFQALSGFHVVSWNQYIIFLLLMQVSVEYAPPLATENHPLS